MTHEKTSILTATIVSVLLGRRQAVYDICRKNAHDAVCTLGVIFHLYVLSHSLMT